MKYTPVNPEEDAIKILPMQFFLWGEKEENKSYKVANVNTDLPNRKQGYFWKLHASKSVINSQQHSRLITE